jgi:hypothetical protein
MDDDIANVVPTVAPDATCVPQPILDAVENDVSEFMRLDTEIKIARKQMKDVRMVINEHRNRIIEHMVGTKTDKLVGINGGMQYLECVKKTLKRRPTLEQMSASLSKAMQEGVTDPTALVDVMRNAGGTYEEYKLSRRTRRVNVSDLLAAEKRVMFANGSGRQQTTIPPPPSTRKLGHPQSHGKRKLKKIR